MDFLLLYCQGIFQIFELPCHQTLLSCVPFVYLLHTSEEIVLISGHLILIRPNLAHNLNELTFHFPYRFLYQPNFVLFVTPCIILFLTVDCTLWANVKRTCKAVVSDLLFTVVLAVVCDFLGRNRFLFLGIGARVSNCLVFGCDGNSFGGCGHSDVAFSKRSEFSDGAGVENSLFLTNFADVDLGMRLGLHRDFVL